MEKVTLVGSANISKVYERLRKIDSVKDGKVDNVISREELDEARKEGVDTTIEFKEGKASSLDALQRLYIKLLELDKVDGAFDGDIKALKEHLEIPLSKEQMEQENISLEIGSSNPGLSFEAAKREIIELEHSLKEIDKLRIDNYRTVAAKLFQLHPAIKPIYLYSLFYCEQSPQRIESIAYLKEVGIFEEVERNRARLTTEAITGKSFGDRENLAIMTLIDKTRFDNFGWLLQTDLERLEQEQCFSKRATDMCNDLDIKDSLESLKNIGSEELRKIFSFIGEPDQYFVGWKITEAGKYAAETLSIFVKTKVLLAIIDGHQRNDLSTISSQIFSSLIRLTNIYRLHSLIGLGGGEEDFIDIAMKASTEMIKLLIESDISISMRDINKSLVIAAGNGLIELVTFLIGKGADINATDDTGNTALIEASHSGALAVVRLLIEHGTNVNAKDHLGNSALSESVSEGRIEVARYLIEKGADVNAKGYLGDTALITASFLGDIETMRLLIEKGADVNAIGDLGHTSLMKASRYGEVEAAKILLEKGANINAKDNKGMNALMHAIDSEFLSFEIIRLLIQKGADINSRDIDRKNALILAILRYRPGLVEYLVAKGADINASDEFGWTPLIWAVRFSTPEVVKMLIDKGADINIKDINGNIAVFEFLKLRNWPPYINEITKILQDAQRRKK